MKSCPRCGSLSIKVGEKTGTYYNPVCRYVGRSRTFSGQPERSTGPSRRETQNLDYLMSGTRRVPTTED